MFLRPAGQSIATPPDSPPIPFTGDVSADANPTGVPRIGLLDGLPLANHELLAGRLIVYYPQGWRRIIRPENGCMEPRWRRSSCGEICLRRQRCADATSLCAAHHAHRHFRALRSESIPADQLTVDLLHSAVKRLYEGEGATPAQLLRASAFSTCRLEIRAGHWTGR